MRTLLPRSFTRFEAIEHVKRHTTATTHEAWKAADALRDNRAGRLDLATGTLYWFTEYSNRYVIWEPTLCRNQTRKLIGASPCPCPR